MRFPNQAREGSDAHADARHRLDDARNHQRAMHDALDGSKDTPGELAAATELTAASEKTAAREAWLTWAESDDGWRAP